VVARLAQVFDPRLKVGDDYFEMMAISTFRFSLAGGDGVGWAKMDIRLRRPNRAAPSLGLGEIRGWQRYGCRAVN
jgi:hypothetical protein